MKKKLFLLPLFMGGVIVTGCSSDDSFSSVDTLPESYTNSYLSVSVIGANAAGTRYTQGDGEYEDGTETENHINKVRFFFFDEKGDAAEVKKETTGDYVSYIDVTNYGTNGNNQNETVEKIIETTLRLNIPDGHDNPKKVLAVINPTSDIEGLENPSLDKLKEKVRDFKTDSEEDKTVELTNNNFVMSNSVYANDTSDEVFGAETLEDRNFQTTDDAAKANPVKIYVERVLARLDFSLALSESKDGNPSKMLKDGTIYKLKTPEGNDGEQYKINDGNNSNDEDLYVKFINWDITGTPVKSRLIKEINANWKTPDLFGSTSELLWTTTDYHRSFWALNPDLGEKPNDATSNTNYKFVSFEEASLDMPNPPSIVSTYLQENANAYSSDMTAAAPDYTTKVIITAQLVGEDGNAKKLAKWLNNYYTLDGVKIAMANLLEDLYYMEDENGDYTQVSPDDLTLGQATIEGAKSYYAQATVDDKKAWYEKDGDTYTPIEDVNNKYIYTKLGYALVWEKGYTYYFFDIHHLGSAGSPAYNGIVRNHIYKTSITSVAGLGTPVYNPEEKIYPEIPGKESIISAKVNILSWRVVSSSYDLTW